MTTYPLPHIRGHTPDVHMDICMMYMSYDTMGLRTFNQAEDVS